MSRKNDSSRACDLGIDSGGTFTDFVARDGRVLKLPSSREEPGRVLEDGAARLLDSLEGSAGRIVHGTTVATNALLEGDLARVGIVTTAGFGDLLRIGRQNRPRLYALEPRASWEVPSAEMVVEVPERLDASGRVLVPLDEEAVLAAGRRLAARGAEALLVAFLHSYREPRHERRARRILADLGLPVTASSEVVAEHREYERFSTALANAALAPRLGRWAKDLEGRLRSLGRRAGLERKPSLGILQSDGGTGSLAAAAREPVRLVLSGPAGGVVGARGLAARPGRRELVTLDMGGTSTDVALIEGEEPVVHRCEIAGRPLLVPVVDVHTVGAGGGSIAHRDAGGGLGVGPASAGADPGPACYGRGGPATVTDAHVVLGRIPVGHFLGGSFELRAEASRAAVGALARSLRLDAEELALGVLRIAEATMERALRKISLERGRDPRRFSLVAFGGAGGLHAARLAQALGMKEAVIPPWPGLLSALGMLHARPRRERSRSAIGSDLETLEARADRFFAPMENGLRRELTAEGVDRDDISLERLVDLRYRGQSYEITVPLSSKGTREVFEAAHERRYGFRQHGARVEAIALRVRALGPEPRTGLRPPRRRKAAAPLGAAEVLFVEGRHETPIWRREELPVGARLSGPAIVVEYSATTVVPPGFTAEVEAGGCLTMRANP